MVLAASAESAGESCKRRIWQPTVGDSIAITLNDQSVGVADVEIYRLPQPCQSAIVLVTTTGQTGLRETASGVLVDGNTAEITLTLDQPYTGTVLVYWVLIPVEVNE